MQTKQNSIFECQVVVTVLLKKCFGKPLYAFWVSSWWNWRRLQPYWAKKESHFERLPLQQSKPSARKFIQICHKDQDLNYHLSYCGASTNYWTPPSISFSHWFRLWWNLAAHLEMPGVFQAGTNFQCKFKFFSRTATPLGAVFLSPTN